MVARTEKFFIVVQVENETIKKIMQEKEHTVLPCYGEYCLNWIDIDERVVLRSSRSTVWSTYQWYGTTDGGGKVFCNGHVEELREHERRKFRSQLLKRKAEATSEDLKHGRT
jgi:hypothetical protein